MRLYILIFILLISSTLKSNDISDFQIEGLSIGDSLLDLVSEKEIITEIELNSSSYNYLNDDFGEVYLFDNLDTYQRLSIFVKQNDKNYNIYAIYGSISFDNRLEECLAKQKEIEYEFSSIFKNAEIEKYTTRFAWDKSGESLSHNTEIILDSNDGVSINCTKYKKNLKIQNNWEDSLQVGLIDEEVFDWFNNPIK